MFGCVRSWCIIILAASAVTPVFLGHSPARADIVEDIQIPNPPPDVDLPEPPQTQPQQAIPVEQRVNGAQPPAPPATQPVDDPAERLPSTRPAHPAPAPPSAALEAARKQIWKQFRQDYDKGSPADRSALGHKLLKLAIVPGTDEAARFAMLREARELAGNSDDERLAVKTADAAAFFFNVDPATEKLAALSSTAWPVDDEDSVRQVVHDWLELSEQAAASNNFDIAATAAARALKLTHGWDDEPWAKVAAAQVTNIDSLRLWRERVNAAAKTLAAHPDDPNANQVVGAQAAAEGNWDKALPMLERAADSVVRLAAGSDVKSPTDAGAQINAGDNWCGAAEHQPRLVADAFKLRARHWYQSALKRVAEKERDAIHERMKGLPGGSIFQTIADAGGSPRCLPPLGGKGGGAFADAPKEPGLLIGVHVTVGNVYGNPCISSIQPIFRTASGKAEGAEHGKHQGQPITVEAREGYAVAGFVMKTGWAIDGCRVVFMRIKDDGLDPEDRYESQWLGGPGGGPETTLGCNGKPVIGLQGRAGGGVDALGLSNPSQ
jgi:hypothetical protein